MKIEFTTFQSVFDNKTHKRMRFDSFAVFESFLYKLAEIKGKKPKKGERRSVKDSMLISPAIYADNETRNNKSVTHWAGWCAVDIDDYEQPFEDVIKTYQKYDYVCYSTASSTEAKKKFRLVFPLTRWIRNEEIKKFWYALNSELNSIGDKQCKDLSRMYYVPARYPNACNFIFSNRGMIIDPDILFEKHPLNLKKTNSILDLIPEEMRKDFLENKRRSLSNTSISWSSYRDCPFVSKKILAEYQTITESGWYIKLYQVMVSIAARAIKMGYPISVNEITRLISEIDADNGAWYRERSLDIEAERALTFVLSESTL